MIFFILFFFLAHPFCAQADNQNIREIVSKLFFDAEQNITEAKESMESDLNSQINNLDTLSQQVKASYNDLLREKKRQEDLQKTKKQIEKEISTLQSEVLNKNYQSLNKIIETEVKKTTDEATKNNATINGEIDEILEKISDLTQRISEL